MCYNIMITSKNKLMLTPLQYQYSINILISCVFFCGRGLRVPRSHLLGSIWFQPQFYVTSGSVLLCTRVPCLSAPKETAHYWMHSASPQRFHKSQGKHWSDREQEPVEWAVTSCHTRRQLLAACQVLPSGPHRISPYK